MRIVTGSITPPEKLIGGILITSPLVAEPGCNGTFHYRIPLRLTGWVAILKNIKIIMEDS